MGMRDARNRPDKRIKVTDNIDHYLVCVKIPETVLVHVLFDRPICL